MAKASKEFVTLSEAADLIGKSVQTVRRMIKKGDLVAKRMKTPQGFHYVLDRKQLDLPQDKLVGAPKAEAKNEPEAEVPQKGSEMLSNSTSQTPIQTQVKVQMDAVKDDPTSQNENLISQSEMEALIANEFFTLDKNPTKAAPAHGEAAKITPTVEKSDELLKLQNELAEEKKGREALLARDQKLLKMLESETANRRFLYQLIARLQWELDYERKRPRGFVDIFMDWFSHWRK